MYMEYTVTVQCAIITCHVVVYWVNLGDSWSPVYRWSLCVYS